MLPVILPPLSEDENDLFGFAAEACEDSAHAKVWVRLGITSDNEPFYRIVEDFSSVVLQRSTAAGQPIDITRVNRFLSVIKSDRSQQIWSGDFPMIAQCITKRDVVAGQPIHDTDLADIRAIEFPFVQLESDDKVFCVLRVGWRFALYFDFNPEKELDIEGMKVTLGALYRELLYRDHYKVLSQAPYLASIIGVGWFPFIEIIGSEFNEISIHVQSGFSLSRLEQVFLDKFDRERMGHLLKRRESRPTLVSRLPILSSAVEAFLRGDPIGSLKTSLTEIEGILRDAHKAKHGNSKKVTALIEFAVQEAEVRASSSATLFFPREFGDYLARYTFCSFDPDSTVPHAGSRHAVGHGAAPAESYTMIKALQAILTIDQLSFYV